MAFKKFGVILLMILVLGFFTSCDDSSDSDSDDDTTTETTGTVSGTLSFVDGSGGGVAGTVKYSVYLMTTAKFTEWNNSGDPSSYASYSKDGEFISTASVYKTDYSIAEVEPGDYQVLAMAWDASDATGEPDLYADTSSTGAITVTAGETKTVDLSVGPMPGSGDTYVVSFSVDGTTVTLENGLTSGGEGGYPSAGYDSDKTTIYAFKDDLDFTTFASTGATGEGLLIFTSKINATGTVTDGQLKYYDASGKMYAATNVEVTITEYGAEDESIKGSFKGATVTDGTNTKSIGDGTFTVVNTGSE